MDCRNCGAPMLLFTGGEYFFCEYCGSFHFPSANQDGVRVLGPAPDRMACPMCRAPLLLASLDRYRGYQCERCRGILIERQPFAELVEHRRAWATEPPARPRPLDTPSLDRRPRCPRCRTPMDTHPYYGPGNIVIDTCARCNLIWLDHGELNQVVNAPGRDRGAAILKKSARKKEEEKRKGKGKKKRKGGIADALSRLFDD